MFKALVLASLTVATTRAETPRFDPLEQAVQFLETLGYFLPTGWTAKEVPSADMPRPALGFTDHESMCIFIDMDKVNATASFTGEVGPGMVYFIAAILLHEYHHTPALGDPSSVGGWGNDFCQHMEAYTAAKADLCALIVELVASGAGVYSLCLLDSKWADTINDNRSLYNSKCDGDEISKQFACPGCAQ